MSFPAYDTYKDSGIEWLGDVPDYWEICRLKFLSDIQTGDKDTVNAEEDAEYAFFVRSQTVERISTFSFNCEAILTAGDGVGVGKVFHYYNGPFDFHQRVYMLNSFREVDGRFLFHYLKANFYKVALEGGAKSTVDSIRRPMIADFPVAFPPNVDEQKAIASFLDVETSKIDGLVSEQRRLIELLKEKRQAVISHAVIKGLNPNAPMKPSGVDWNGEIPQHWSVRPIRTLANVVRGGSPRPAGDPKYFNGDFMPWVTVAEITRDNLKGLTGTDTFLTQEGSENSRMFEPNTLLYSNSGATLGVPKILEIQACANDGVIGFLDLSDEVDISFLYFFLYSITEAIREKVKQGSGQPNLNTNIVKALRLPLPPDKNEQKEIVDYIEAICSKFDTLEAEAERAIELLQERRTALISAAVTGKIDVRGLVSKEAVA